MSGATRAVDRAQPRPSVGYAWGLLGLRLGLVTVSSLIAWSIVQATTGVQAFPPATQWITLGLLPVNVILVLLMGRLYRAQGVTLSQAMGIIRGRIGWDILWGLLWLVVLNVPFVLVITATVWLMYGAQAPQAFETIFVNPQASIALDPVPQLMIGLIAVIPFMVLNSPVEELVFRGVGLDGLQQATGRFVAIIITAVLFGAQHVFFAATPPAMVVFFAGFTVWGFLAAVIATRQGRLFPLIIAHWMINILMSIPAILFPLLHLTGVIDVF